MLQHSDPQHDKSTIEDDGYWSDDETDSLSLDAYDFKQENGRTYHNYHSENNYWGPNDERAKDLEDLVHHIFTTLLGGGLYIAPLEKPPLKILDLGTGTGTWAIDAAYMHPEATVCGIDLSPIQPAYVPKNFEFLLDDYNLEWAGPKDYDLVNQRMLLGTVKNLPDHYAKTKDALNPGGWFNIAELLPLIYSNKSAVYKKWNNAILKAGEQAGMAFDTARKVRPSLKEAGFINVVEKIFRMPIGWRRGDSKPKVVSEGRQSQWKEVVELSLYWEEALEDISMRRLTQTLGWELQEAKKFYDELRTELRNDQLRPYCHIYVVAGQKPWV